MSALVEPNDIAAILKPNKQVTSRIILERLLAGKKLPKAEIEEYRHSMAYRLKYLYKKELIARTDDKPALYSATKKQIETMLAHTPAIKLMDTSGMTVKTEEEREPIVVKRTTNETLLNIKWV